MLVGRSTLSEISSFGMAGKPSLDERARRDDPQLLLTGKRKRRAGQGVGDALAPVARRHECVLQVDRVGVGAGIRESRVATDAMHDEPERGLVVLDS